MKHSVRTPMTGPLIKVVLCPDQSELLPVASRTPPRTISARRHAGPPNSCPHAASIVVPGGGSAFLQGIFLREIRQLSLLHTQGYKAQLCQDSLTEPLTKGVLCPIEPVLLRLRLQLQPAHAQFPPHWHTGQPVRIAAPRCRFHRCTTVQAVTAPHASRFPAQKGVNAAHLK